MKNKSLWFFLFILLFFVTSCNNKNQTKEEEKNNIADVCTVVFETSGGTKVDSQEIEKNTTLGSPVQPVKEGYEFSGWYYDRTFTIPFNFQLKVNRSITLYAKWLVKKCNISLYDEEATLFSSKYDYGTKVEEVAKPNKQGYVFEDFYWDKEQTRKVDISDEITEDQVFYCKFVPSTKLTYKVSYYGENSDNANNTLLKQLVLIGTLDQEVMAPTEEFVGFDCISELVKGNILADESLELKVYYQRKKYNINYFYNGELYQSSTPYKYQQKITYLKEGIVDGYLFEGWYLDTNFTTKPTDTVMPLNDITLYAKNTPIVEGSSGFTYTLNSSKNGYLITGYKGTETNLTVPSGYLHYPIVGVSSLKNNSTISSITFNSACITFSSSCFEGCSSLTTINFPEGCKTIPDNCFKNCTSLTSVVVPSSVTSISLLAFTGCSKLSCVTVLSTNKKYSSNDGVLFDSSKNLLYYPIGKMDENYTVPSGTKSLLVRCFQENAWLKNLTCANDVTTISSEAIRGCKNLQTLTLGAKVKTIESTFIDLTTSLTEINVDNNNQYYLSIDGVLYNKEKTILIHYPSSKTNAVYIIPGEVTTILYGAISHNPYLEGIVLDESLIKFDYHAIFDNPNAIVYLNNHSSFGTYSIEKVNEIIQKEDWEYQNEIPYKKEEKNV